MLRIPIGEYELLCAAERLPSLYDHYTAHAEVVDESVAGVEDREAFFVGVARWGGWPFLVFARQYSSDGGFHPGVLLVPETETLFLGVGERVFAYRLDPPERLWEDGADAGFWWWSRHGDVVLMAAELELAAWTAAGRKLWTTFVEPPWGYAVEGGTVRLDVMGNVREFPLATGPARG